jgi:hypothetical protein
MQAYDGAATPACVFSCIHHNKYFLAATRRPDFAENFFFSHSCVFRGIKAVYINRYCDRMNSKNTQDRLRIELNSLRVDPSAIQNRFRSHSGLRLLVLLHDIVDQSLIRAQRVRLRASGQLATTATKSTKKEAEENFISCCLWCLLWLMPARAALTGDGAAHLAVTRPRLNTFRLIQSLFSLRERRV